MSGSSTVNVTGLPQIADWQLARDHGALLDVALAIPDTNLFSEPRNPLSAPAVDAALGKLY